MSAGAFYRASVRRALAMPPLWVMRARAPMEISIEGKCGPVRVAPFEPDVRTVRVLFQSDEAGTITVLDWPDAPIPSTPPAGGGSSLIAVPVLGAGAAGDAGVLGLLPGVATLTPSGVSLDDDGSAQDNGLAAGSDAGQPRPRAGCNVDASQCHTRSRAKAGVEAPADGLAGVEPVSRPARPLSRAGGGAEPAELGEVRKAPPKVDWAKVASAHRSAPASGRNARRAPVFEADPDLAGDPPPRRPRPAPVRPSVARTLPAPVFAGKRHCGQCDKMVTSDEGGRCRDRFCRIGGAK